MSARSPSPERRRWRDLALAGCAAILLGAAAAAPVDDDDDDDDDDDEMPAMAAPGKPGAPLSGAPAAAAVARSEGDGATRLNAGIGPYAYPLYPGARRYGVLPFPLVIGEWGDRVEIDSLDGVRVTALELGDFSFGPAVRYRFGRQASDNQAQLAGLRSFGPALELGGFASYELGPVVLDTVLTQDVTQQHKGAVLDLGAWYTWERRGVALEIGPTIRAVSGAYNRSFFSVPDQVSGTALSPYKALAGWERVGAEAAVSIPIVGRWSLQLLGEYGHLLGNAARSPIVTQGGSANQWFGGAFLTWRF